MAPGPDLADNAENPGWLHSAENTRAYIDALLEAVLEAGHGAVLVDVQRTLQREMLRGACIVVHSMDQARTQSVLLPRARHAYTD